MESLVTWNTWPWAWAIMGAATSCWPVAGSIIGAPENDNMSITLFWVKKEKAENRKQVQWNYLYLFCAQLFCTSQKESLIIVIFSPFWSTSGVTWKVSLGTTLGVGATWATGSEGACWPAWAWKEKTSYLLPVCQDSVSSLQRKLHVRWQQYASIEVSW